MTTATATRRYPVAREAAFAYLTDPGHWPDFYSGVLDAGSGFERAGDSVPFTYTLLGRHLHGRARLEAIDPGWLIRHTASVDGLPDVHQTWVYRDAGDGVEIDVTMETADAEGFFGRPAGRHVIAGIIEHDLARTMDAIADLFALGVPGEEPPTEGRSGRSAA